MRSPLPEDLSLEEIADVLRLLAQHEFLAARGMAQFLEDQAGGRNLTPGLTQKRRQAYVAAMASTLFFALAKHDEAFRDFLAGLATVHPADFNLEVVAKLSASGGRS